MLSRLFGSRILLLVLAFAAGLAGAASWTFLNAELDRRTAHAIEAAKDEAVHALRSDPAACSRGLAYAANTCGALIRFDRAAQEIAAWAQPVDRPQIQTTLNAVRDAILLLEGPSWVHSLDWMEEGALRRAKALQAAAETLKTRGDGPEKVALSAKLSDILRVKLLETPDAP